MAKHSDLSTKHQYSSVRHFALPETEITSFPGPCTSLKRTWERTWRLKQWHVWFDQCVQVTLTMIKHKEYRRLAHDILKLRVLKFGPIQGSRGDISTQLSLWASSTQLQPKTPVLNLTLGRVAHPQKSGLIVKVWANWNRSKQKQVQGAAGEGQRSNIPVFIPILSFPSHFLPSSTVCSRPVICWTK